MTSHPRVGVGVIIKDSQGRILLGKRLKSVGAHTWGPPGGHLEFGETIEACAIREVQEEVGVTILQPQFVGFTNDVFHEEGKHYVSFFLSAFLAESDKIRVCEPEKVETWQWFDVQDLPENLFLTFRNFLKSYTL